MAATNGHGNPDWTRDETILALELYLACADRIPSGSDPRVVKLSERLRALAIHPRENRVESFRNPDGVSFKLQNLRQVASGKGLANVSKTDREVWAAFGHKPREVTKLAALIGEVSASAEAESLPAVDVDEEFLEGRLITATHYRRERSPKLRAKLLAARAKGGKLCCDGCGWSPGFIDALIADAAFEAHHVKPLAATGPRSNRISDLALLCANCHRLVHRWIATKGEWPERSRIHEIVRPPEESVSPRSDAFPTPMPQ